mmetsp:Transcript_12661/g.23953  ORF Transcript_12661/g.23953 Transcript_12661/m.23953 type:complete len:135 (+) Transcript_12661:31-435(+)
MPKEGHLSPQGSKPTAAWAAPQKIIIKKSAMESAKEWSKDEQKCRWSLGDDARIKDKADLWSKGQCKNLLAVYGKCAKDRVVSVAWACGKERDAYVQCLKKFSSEPYLSMLKTESINLRIAQMRQAKELEKAAK